jgi:hypothetical protein
VFGNVQDLLRVDFGPAENQAFRHSECNGLQFGGHEAAAFVGRAAAWWFDGFWHYWFPSDTKKPQRPDWTCGG